MDYQIDKEKLDELTILAKEGFYKAPKVKDSDISVLRINDVKLHNLTTTLPKHTHNEFKRLLESIAENGQLDPVTVWKKRGSNWVIDGRHRLKALKMLGIDYIKVIFIPSSMSLKELETFIIEKENRREMTASKRAISGYFDWKNNNMTYSDVIKKWHTNNSNLSRCKRIDTELGENTLHRLYDDGYVVLNGQTFKNITSIGNAIDKWKEAEAKAKRDREIGMRDDLKPMANQILTYGNNDDKEALYALAALIEKQLNKRKLDNDLDEDTSGGSNISLDETKKQTNKGWDD